MKSCQFCWRGLDPWVLGKKLTAGPLGLAIVGLLFA